MRELVKKFADWSGKVLIVQSFHVKCVRGLEASSYADEGVIRMHL